MRLVPIPVAARHGWERTAFVFFLLGVATCPGTGVANVCLGLCLSATVVWRLRARAAGEPFLEPFRRTSPLHAPIAAFVLVSIVSCVFSTLPARSLQEIKGFGTFLLVPFSLALLRTDEDVDLVLDMWRITAAYLALRGLFEWLAGSDNLGERLRAGVAGHMTYAGLLMVLSLAVGARGFRRRPGLSGVADVAVGLLGAVLVGLTLTRSALMGLFAGILAALVVTKPRLLLLVPMLALGFVFVMPGPVRERALSTFDVKDETTRDRLVMWRAGLGMIRDRPLFGVGPGRVKELYPVYRGPGFVDPHPGHLHDNVVMIAAETGIFSALVYLGFVAAFFVHAVRRLRRASSPFRRSVIRGSIAAMAAVTLAGLFEYNFGDVEVLMATLVVASLPFCLPEEESTRSTRSAGRGGPTGERGAPLF